MEGPLLGDGDIFRPQVLIQIAGFPAKGQRGAQIQSQVHTGQVRHGVVFHICGQGCAIRAEDPQIGTYLALRFGRQLEPLERHGGSGSGKLLKRLHFLHHFLCNAVIITPGSLSIRAGTGQQQGVYLPLGLRDGDML